RIHQLTNCSLTLSGTTHRSSRPPSPPPGFGATRPRGTPDSKFAGGHRSRVTPVPIPNTEVKPATADGTAWETVWESRSLPALSRSPRSEIISGFFLTGGSHLRPSSLWRRVPTSSGRQSRPHLET